MYLNNKNLNSRVYIDKYWKILINVSEHKRRPKSSKSVQYKFKQVVKISNPLENDLRSYIRFKWHLHNSASFHFCHRNNTVLSILI